MSQPHASGATRSTAGKPVRLWPGVVIVLLQWLARFVLPVIVPEAQVFGVLGGVLGGLLLVLWWVFFSRAAWVDRLGAIVVAAAAQFAVVPFLDASIARGAQGMLLVILATPVLSLAFVAWAVASRGLAATPRRAWMAATILLASGVWTLVRTEGITGDIRVQLRWRWTATSEQQLMATTSGETRQPAPATPPLATPAEPGATGTGEKPASPRSAPAAAHAAQPPVATETRDKAAAVPSAVAVRHTEANWPGFRGAERDGVVRGVRIQTDWSTAPPVALWRRPVGPGWSSFAVDSGLVYTQEQRGSEEVVACYRLTTGEPVWRHADPARFWESNGGAGPRATPALSDGRVFAFGATGILNALDAHNGAAIWSRSAAADTRSQAPTWGFASSPLVTGDLVIVAVAGQLAAYDAETGAARWVGPDGGSSYSSPHLVTIDGVLQVLLVTAGGLTSVESTRGTVLWQHAWSADAGILQPALTPDGGVLFTVGNGSGIRRLAVAPQLGGWTVEARWTSRGLKPYFSDFVVHKGHAYGFDGGILSCIDLGAGERAWKGGRYGHGQLVLLSDQDLLVVLSEDGELALVGATPDGFTELVRVPALEGKTWNHPVVAGDILLVRNDREMAAFRLPVAAR